MRLIDANELMEHAYRDKLNSRELITQMIENAPTVKAISTYEINKISLDVIMEEQSYVRKDATKDELLYLMGFNDGVIELLNRLKGSAEDFSEVKE